MSCSTHISCLRYSVAPHSSYGLLFFLVISHHLQTDLCNCLLLLSCHLRIQEILSVSKLISVVPILHFLLPSFQIFRPLPLFSFTFHSGSLLPSVSFSTYLYDEIFILGDFNIHHQLWLSSSFTEQPDEQGFNFTILHDLEQLVQFPTRIPDCLKRYAQHS